MFSEKVWWQSKTIWVNVLTMVVGLLTMLAGQDFIADNPSTVSFVAMVVGVVNVVLRWLTDQPIGLNK